MSSSKAAAKSVRVGKAVQAEKAGAAKLRSGATTLPPDPGVTDRTGSALQLAAELRHSLTAGELDVLPPEAVQELLSAACRLYAAQIEAGQQYLPVTNVTSTDLMVTASGLLKAGNLAVFELGMWQSWTGR